VESNGQERSRMTQHPVFVAGSVFTATVTLGIIFVTQIVCPTQTASLGNKVSEVVSENDSLHRRVQSLKSAADEQRNTIIRLRESYSDLRRRLAEAEYSNLLVSGSPYPVGLGKVKVGDPISLLEKYYPSDRIKYRKDGRKTLYGQSEIFDRVTYYFEVEDGESLITHIVFPLNFDEHFDLGSDQKNEFLLSRLVDSLGQPKDWGDGYYSWECRMGGNVFFEINKRYAHSYIVMQTGFRPAGWPE